jgi:hypothetical protein
VNGNISIHCFLLFICRPIYFGFESELGSTGMDFGVTGLVLGSTGSVLGVSELLGVGGDELLTEGGINFTAATPAIAIATKKLPTPNHT